LGSWARWRTSTFAEQPGRFQSGPGQDRRNFPNENGQDFSPEIMEKNLAKMEKNLDMKS